MITVSTAKPQRHAEALSLLFAHLPPEEHDEQVHESLNAFSNGQLSPEGLLVAERGGVLVGALLYLMQPDRCIYVWPPSVSTNADLDTVAGALLDETRKRARDHDAWIAQCLVDPEAASDRELLVRNGFFHLTDLNYLNRPVSDDLPSLPSIPLEKTTFDGTDAGLRRFADVIQRTYAGSLDCPGLKGIRTAADAMASHRATGVFLPKLWTVFGDERGDAGVLLFADHPDDDAWEVVYMGIVPEARGRDYGRAMLLNGLHEARADGRDSIALAVDSRNHYAGRVYEDLGFRQTDVRSVHVYVPKA